MTPTYDERQTAACALVRERLISVISRANDALMGIGTDACTDALEDVLRDAEKALETNEDITQDLV